MLITLVIALATYLGMVFSTKYRMPIAVLGSGLILIYGSISKTFPADTAFSKFPTEIIILIVVLGIFTKIFENNGFFDYVGDKFFEITGGSKTLIAVLVPFLIYATSLFMNNLSVILLFTFICLNLAVKLRIPVTPLLVSAIIASNIGGCPLPWADTPAVILTSYSDFNLIDFLTKLFIPCAIYIILLMIYTLFWFKYMDHETPPPTDVNKEFEEEMFLKPPHPPSPPLLHPPHGGPKPPLPLQGGTTSNELSDMSYFVKPWHLGISPTHDGLQYLKWGSPEFDKTTQEDDLKEDVIETKPWHLKNLPPTHDGLQYLTWTTDYNEKIDQDEKLKKLAKLIETFAVEMYRIPASKSKWGTTFLPITLFFLLILSICIAPFFKISIAYVSLFFGAIMLLVDKAHPEDTVNALPILDSLIFISALFLIAGAMEYSGILKAAVNFMLTFIGESKFLIIICIMFAAFFIATFLSAGPAAATLLPICQQISPMIGHRLAYAALALGILAGSSMLPWSATGGPVMLGEVNRFLRRYSGSSDDITRIKKIFNLKLYLKFSIPFSLIILILSGIFLSLYLLIFK